MTRAKTKAPARQAKQAQSTAKKSRTTSARKSQSAAQRIEHASISDERVERLNLHQASADPQVPVPSAPLEEPSAIKKGRQPKHINSTQAIALGTAAAGVSHLLGWL